jgi:hypothetical protein
MIDPHTFGGHQMVVFAKSDPGFDLMATKLLRLQGVTMLMI